MAIDLTRFHPDMLPAAAALLAARHQRDRAAQPLLPEGPENPALALAAVESVWTRAGAQGAAAVEDGRLRGYLIGRMEVDTLRGRTTWVSPAGHALAPDASPDLYRDLYATAAPPWLDRGCFVHHVLAPAEDRATQAAWFAAGFGREQAHAALAIRRDAAATPPPTPPGITIRVAASDDREALRQVAHVIARHQMGPPTWAVASPEYLDEIASGYAEACTDEAATFWLALRGERVVAFQGYYRPEPADDDMLTPQHSIELAVAATIPQERGRGLMRLLTAHGLKAAYSAGNRACVIDWRVTNLLASRFWPTQGFVPTAYRLVRRVDPRIAWACRG